MLRPVDRIEVLVLVDNKTDSLSSIPASAASKEFHLEFDTLLKNGMTELKGSSQCCALHGLSLLVTAHRGSQSRTVLFDAGPVNFGMDYNGERLGAKFGEVDAVMLSHGHWDHAGGLTRAFDLIKKQKLEDLPTPCYLHPDMFRQRGLAKPSGEIFPIEKIPTPEELKEHGARPVITTEPCSILEDMFYISAEIERITSYEKGFPNHMRKISDDDSKWEPDPLIMDERFLAVNINDKGLVIFSACSHAGIVNVMKSAKKNIGEKIHAVVGGFHLSGAANELTIDDTVEGFKEFDPDVIVPGHCTGWRAVQALATQFGPKVVPMAVGMGMAM
eukprot:GFUD01089523.1.p1 GENE.GFUD01089523.1~~GFUD01089523.1.p1  ORF type:complete len:331 (-),score=88.20 GFUD01089523.1:254-1246(-)